VAVAAGASASIPAKRRSARLRDSSHFVLRSAAWVLGPTLAVLTAWIAYSAYALTVAEGALTQDAQRALLAHRVAERAHATMDGLWSFLASPAGTREAARASVNAARAALTDDIDTLMNGASTGPLDTELDALPAGSRAEDLMARSACVAVAERWMQTASCAALGGGAFVAGGYELGATKLDEQVALSLAAVPVGSTTTDGVFDGRTSLAAAHVLERSGLRDAAPVMAGAFVEDAEDVVATSRRNMRIVSSVIIAVSVVLFLGVLFPFVRVFARALYASRSAVLLLPPELILRVKPVRDAVFLLLQKQRDATTLKVNPSGAAAGATGAAARRGSAELFLA
jgi:hypothetical protein